MNLREAFLASKLFGNGGGGGGTGDNIWDKIAEGTYHETISGSASYVRSYAFYSMPISGAVFPNASRIDRQAFQGCSYLQTASFGNASHISYYAFSGCESLASIYAPNLISMSDGVFSGCTALTSVDFPKLQYTFGGAFYRCLNLQYVSLPSLTYIASQAFRYCSALQSIYLPMCLSISSHAMAECPSLSAVYFPALQKFTATWAFNACTNLMSVYMLGSTVVTGTSSNFNNTPIVNSSYTGEWGSLFVRASLLSAYQTSWAWASDRLVGLTDEQIAALPI